MTVLKKFGLGILWALLSPIILVAVALIGVFGAVDFVIEFGIMIVNFFRGKKLFPLYPEDEKALEILQRAIDRKNGELNAQSQPSQPQQVFVQQNFYTTPGSMPPPTSPMGVPPGYGYPGINQANPQQPFQQIPSQQQPYQQIPEQQPYQPAPGQPFRALPQEQEPMPQRPDLAKLPEFNPSDYRTGTDTIDIDIDEGGNGNE